MTVRNHRIGVNPIPSPNTISALWHELSIMADIVPEGQRPGLVMARTRLLDGVPSWRLPATLDALADGRALA
jgi:hypothetical protein